MDSEFANAVGLMFGVVPLVLAVWFLKELKPLYHRYWFFGVIFLIISAALFALLGSVTDMILTVRVNNQTKEVVTTLAIWAYVGPAVLLAIGANLITQFLVLKKPEKSFKSRVVEVLTGYKKLSGYASFILSAPPLLNKIVVVSLVVIAFKIFWLNRIPEYFAGFYQLGLIFEAVLASVLASYIFYLIVVHRKQLEDKKAILPSVNKLAQRLVADCKTQLREFEKATQITLDFEQLNKEDLKQALSKINPNDQTAPLHIYNKGQATWLEYLVHHSNRSSSHITSINPRMVFLEAQFAALLTDLELCHYFNHLGMVATTANAMRNTDLSFLSSSFYQYYQQCKALEAAIESQC